MNRLLQIKSAFLILQSRIFQKRIPIAVRWNLLYRCTSKCIYCNLWDAPVKEIGTEEIFPILRQLKELGTTQISFSGGEPLLREDIGRIIEETARLGISPTMNTNGFNLAKRVDGLGRLDLLKISLDGPEEIHDLVRNRKGSFREAIKAAEIGSARLKKISFATTITRFNINHLDFMLDLAERFNTSVAFQPLKSIYRGVKDIQRISPSPEEFHRAVSGLIERKKGGNKHIRNSLAELKRLLCWPDYPPMRCGSGYIFVMIDPDGTLMPCDRVQYEVDLPSILKLPVVEALELLPEVKCTGCGFCGSQQLNSFYSFKPWPLKEVINLT